MFVGAIASVRIDRVSDWWLIIFLIWRGTLRRARLERLPRISEKGIPRLRAHADWLWMNRFRNLRPSGKSADKLDWKWAQLQELRGTSPYPWRATLRRDRFETGLEIQDPRKYSKVRERDKSQGRKDGRWDAVCGPGHDEARPSTE